MVEAIAFSNPELSLKVGRSVFTTIAQTFLRLFRNDYGAMWKAQMDTGLTKLCELGAIDEANQDKVSEILEDLRNNQIYYNTNKGDEDKESNILLDLPWDGLPQDQKDHLIKSIELISNNSDALIASPGEHEFEFDFNYTRYAVQAVIMLKFQTKLQDVHDELVPDLVSEENFWQNFFYQFEFTKDKIGLQHSLGERIPTELRVQRITAGLEQLQVGSGGGAAKTASKVTEADSVEMVDLQAQEKVDPSISVMADTSMGMNQEQSLED